MEFTDEYTHPVPGVMYFGRSLPTKEVEYLYQDDLRGCNCEKECTSENKCPCLERSGTFYKYDSVFVLSNYFIQENSIKSPTYECSEQCTCVRSCGNKLVQFGPRRGLKIESTVNEKKGLGLFTLENIKKGNFICEYAGEIILEKEAFNRYTTNKKHNKMNYIFCISECFGEQLTKTFIDPTYYGNIGRYINHSCAPNCKLFVVRINNTMPVLGIFAQQDIDENTELTYDYGEGSIEFENAGNFSRKQCYCNSLSCRKYLPFDISLSAVK